MVEGARISLSATQPTQRGISSRILYTDLNKAIDAYCQHGKQTKGYDKYGKNMFRYPEEGHPQFYGGEGFSMHLIFGAKTVNDGDAEPYEDIGWCKDYDWKSGKDDCTYALRRLY